MTDSQGASVAPSTDRATSAADIYTEEFLASVVIVNETAVTQRQMWPLPSPWTEAVYFLDLGPRASKKVEHWHARLCGKQRKSTASGQGEGKRAWRARVRAVATPFDCAGATLHSSQHFAKIDRERALP